MKIYLIDPKKKWYKANLHGHTTHSDGEFTPLQTKQAYLEHGYNIIAYTDHELIFDVSDLTDENFVAITGSEYSITNNKNTVNDTYIDPTEELSWADYETIHLCMFSKDPHNTFHFACGENNITEYNKNKYAPNEIKMDGYNREFTLESIQKTINLANKSGFLVQFNHPNWSLNNIELIKKLKGLWGFEILNYGTQLETGSEYCVNLYDELIREGSKMVCTMNDDNHNHNGFEDSFGGFNFIGVDKLNYENVIKAMENGDIYCSNGPEIKSLYIDTDDDKIYVETSKAKSIIMINYNRRFRHYYGDNITKGDFKIFGREKYFRICVLDENGKAAQTHAYFLKDYGYK